MYPENYNIQYVVQQLPDYLRDLTFFIAAECNADIGMSLTTLASGMSSGVHGLKFAYRPDGGSECLQTFSIVLAGPTSGKTEIYKKVFKPHHLEDMQRYSIYTEIKEADLPARMRDVLLTNPSYRDVLECVEGTAYATWIAAHDGNSLINSNFFRRNLDIANVLWDSGDKVMIRLPNGHRLTAFDAGLGMLLMTQPDTFQSYRAKSRDNAMSLGFYQRCLFTITSELLVNPALIHGLPEDGFHDYCATAAAYLQAQREMQEAGTVERQGIHFSCRAKSLWFELKEELSQQREFHPHWVQQAVNRAMQNVTRLAGVIHCYQPHTCAEHPEATTATKCVCANEISTSSLNAAWAIVMWHLNQFKQLFPPQPLPMPEVPKINAHGKRFTRVVEDGDMIMVAFQMQRRKSGELDAMKSVVRTRSGLYPQRFEGALIALIDQKFIVEEGVGKNARLCTGPYFDSYAPLPTHRFNT